MNTRRFVAAVSVVIALAVTSPARAEWTNPDPGPHSGEPVMGDMILAAQLGIQIAQVAL